MISTQAEHAHKEFIERFQKGIIPEDLEEHIYYTTMIQLILAQLLKQIDLTQSTSESIRLVKQGAVKINGEKVADPALITSFRADLYYTSWQT